MTPKARAKQLVDEMGFSTNNTLNRKTGEYEPIYRNQYAKECALRAVELRIDAYCCPPVGGIEWAEKKEKYWQNVKQEIDKM